MKRPETRKIVLTLAETLSVRKTCEKLGLEKEELRQVLLGLLGEEKERKKPERAEGFQLYVDGASRGNPGPAGAGIIISRGGETIEGIAQYLDEKTNNQAEYEALILGLERLKELGARKIEVRSDSELLVKQINGEYKVKNPDLKVLHKKAKGIIKGFGKFSIKHIPRNQNTEADNLANRAIDEFT